MSNPPSLVPADQLAATNKIHYPNESTEYRTARDASAASSATTNHDRNDKEENSEQAARVA